MQIIFTLLALFLTYLLLRYPTQAMDYASTGLLLWFQKMIPTLLPFMILSGIMVRMNLTERFAKCFHPLFHKIWGTSLNGSYVILMGMLCGFPMGARVIGEPLCYGCLRQKVRFSNHKPVRAASVRMASAPVPQTQSLLSAIDDSVISGLIGIGKLGGYMVFFNLLNIVMLPFSNLPDRFLAFCNCILEITSGISRVGSKGFYMVLILLPFGGLSCMAQTYSMIKDTNLSLTRYFFHKCIQTAITALIYVFVCAFGSVHNF